MRFYSDDQFNALSPLRVIEDHNMIIQWRKPRSSKKRIAKKWSRVPNNFRPDTNAMVDNINRVIYCHPSIAIRIKSMLP